MTAADAATTTVTATQLQYSDAEPTPVCPSFCSQCGAKVVENAAFCTACGNRLTTTIPPAVRPPAYAQANPSNTNPYSYVASQPAAQSAFPARYRTEPMRTAQDDAARLQLVDRKTEYYIPRFREMEEQNRKNSWNWAAFFLAPYWLLYRKLYGLGAAALVVDLLISLIGSTVLSTLAIGGYAVVAVFANHWYRMQIDDKVSQAKTMGEPHRSRFLAMNGGVNLAAAIAAAAGRVLIMLLLTA
jgi:hypothetical protein